MSVCGCALDGIQETRYLAAGPLHLPEHWLPCEMRIGTLAFPDKAQYLSYMKEMKLRQFATP